MGKSAHGKRTFGRSKFEKIGGWCSRMWGHTNYDPPNNKLKQYRNRSTVSHTQVAKYHQTWASSCLINNAIVPDRRPERFLVRFRRRGRGSAANNDGKNKWCTWHSVQQNCRHFTLRQTCGTCLLDTLCHVPWFYGTTIPQSVSNVNTTHVEHCRRRNLQRRRNYYRTNAWLDDERLHRMYFYNKKHINNLLFLGPQKHCCIAGILS
jgi:hypothetical protein